MYIHIDIWTFPTYLANYIDRYEEELEIEQNNRLHVTADFPAHLEPDSAYNGILVHELYKRSPKDLSSPQTGQNIIPRRRRQRQEVRVSDTSVKIVKFLEYTNKMHLILHALTTTKLWTLASRLEEFFLDRSAIFGQYRMKVVSLGIERLETLRLPTQPHIYRLQFDLDITTVKVVVDDGPAMNQLEIQIGTNLVERPSVSEAMERVMGSIWGTVPGEGL